MLIVAYYSFQEGIQVRISLYLYQYIVHMTKNILNLKLKLETFSPVSSKHLYMFLSQLCDTIYNGCFFFLSKLKKV